MKNTLLVIVCFLGGAAVWHYILSSHIAEWEKEKANVEMAWDNREKIEKELVIQSGMIKTMGECNKKGHSMVSMNDQGTRKMVFACANTRMFLLENDTAMKYNADMSVDEVLMLTIDAVNMKEKLKTLETITAN